MAWEDILIGFTIAGFVAVFVPNTFWQTIFLKGTDGSTLSFLLQVVWGSSIRTNWIFKKLKGQPTGISFGPLTLKRIVVYIFILILLADIIAYFIQ